MTIKPQEADARSATLAHKLQIGRLLTEAGEHLASIRHFGSVLQCHRDQVDAYEGAVRALIAALTQNAVLDQWDDIERDRFYSTLILQEDVPKGPPILHYRLASEHTSGSVRFLRRIALKLNPIIRKLLDSQRLNKNLVIIILLLRESLTIGLSQKEISRLHVEWVDKFTLDDLAIPYNCMFDADTFRRNRDDIVAFWGACHERPRHGNRLSLYHIVFFEWLTQQNPQRRTKKWLTHLLEAHSKTNPLPEEELAAAKSLLIRHWHANLSGSGFWQLLDANFSNLAHESWRQRDELKRSPFSGRTSLGMRLFHNRAWQGLQVAKSLARARLPFIARPRRAKVAICVSGQLRGYVKAFQSWKSSLLQDVNYEVFVHSWRNIGRSGAEPWRYVLPFEGAFFTERYREISRHIGLEEIKALYPSLFRALANSGDVTEEELARFYNTAHIQLDDDSQAPFANLSNAEKMHCKIQSCFEMMMTSGNNYDLIIRLRPDKPVKYLGYDWDDMRKLCHARPLLFADIGASVHYANPMIGDQFAIGAQEPMHVYSSTWSRYPLFAANGLLKCPKSFQGHVSLAQICWLHGIEVKRAPIGFGTLQEPDHLSSESIRACIENDSAGRMNRTDVLLLEAVAADIRISSYT